MNDLIERAKKAWNEKADQYNQWDTLAYEEHVLQGVKAQRPGDKITTADGVECVVVTEETLMQLWLDGFDASGEGWNGEHPLDDRVGKWKVEQAQLAMIQAAGGG